MSTEIYKMLGVELVSLYHSDISENPLVKYLDVFINLILYKMKYL